MKKLLSALVLLNVLGFGTASAHALDGAPRLNQAEFASRIHKAELLAERVKRVQTYENKIKKLEFNNTQWERRGPAVQIPELDANAAGAALALLIGGTFVLVERRKRVAV
ncbi:MAG: hypothetical protein RL701_2583 [Pseudomonadota bacterium]